MQFFASFALLLSCVSAVPFRLENRARFSGGTIRGVNLGGWLVLEPWITPSLFQAWGDNPPVDEWGLCAADRGKAQSMFSEHWASYITEGDFQKIKQSGLNAVRIPIGYWAFKRVNGDPYVSGQAAYLDKAIGWASAAGLAVYIDLHGAPGSQNGFDNSGKRGSVDWQQGNNVQHTLDVLGMISKRYASNKAVAGIQLLNEPLGSSLDMSGVKSFSKQGFGKVREVSGEPVVVIHDAFQPPKSWNGEYGSHDANVMIDHHKYFVFDSGALSMSHQDRISAACNSHSETAGTSNWAVVGEWSGAFTDCTKWLNGVGRGARYDGSYQSSFIGKCDMQGGEISNWSDEVKQQTRDFISAQLHSMESNTNGWFFWTWKTESSPAWDLQRLIGAGIANIGGGNNPCS